MKCLPFLWSRLSVLAHVVPQLAVQGMLGMRMQEKVCVSAQMFKYSGGKYNYSVLKSNMFL